MKNRLQRRGAMLVLVVMVTALVGGLLTLLATNVAHFHRGMQIDRVREAAQAITDSATHYARAQRPTWSKAPPEATIELDIKALLPARMRGTAKLNFLTLNDVKICRVYAQAEWGPILIAREADVPIDVLENKQRHLTGTTRASSIPPG